jgi:hypothetical protein
MLDVLVALVELLACVPVDVSDSASRARPRVKTASHDDPAHRNNAAAD